MNQTNYNYYLNNPGIEIIQQKQQNTSTQNNLFLNVDNNFFSHNIKNTDLENTLKRFNIKEYTIFNRKCD